MHRSMAVLLTGALAACTGPNPAYHGPSVAPDALEPPSADSTQPLPRDSAGSRLDAEAAATPDAAPPDASAPRPSADVRADLGPAPSSLLGYWPFDDGPATGRAEDWSGRNHHGTLQDLTSAKAWAPGRAAGMALSVPAASGTSSLPRVRVAETAAIDGLQAFTISAWFYRTAVPANVHDSIISRQLGTGNNEVFNLTCNNHDLIIYIPPAPTGGSQMTFEVRAGNVCLPRTWVHAAATYNGTVLRLFVNGAQVGMNSFSGRLRSSPGAPIYIGANQNSNFLESFEGLIDDVALFSTALLAPDIDKLFKGATPFEL
jgi:hypothetical protein